MIIVEYRRTLYPQIPQGIKMANEMEAKLKEQGCFVGRAEDTQSIIINSFYRFVVEDEKSGE